MTTCVPGRILGYNGIGAIDKIGSGVFGFPVGDKLLISYTSWTWKCEVLAQRQWDAKSSHFQVQEVYISISHRFKFKDILKAYETFTHASEIQTFTAIIELS